MGESIYKKFLNQGISGNNSMFGSSGLLDMMSQMGIGEPTYRASMEVGGPGDAPVPDIGDIPQIEVPGDIGTGDIPGDVPSVPGDPTDPTEPGETGTGSGLSLADWLQEKGEEWWTETGELREDVLTGWEELMAGDYDPTASPLWDPGKSNLEDQYAKAREQMMAGLPSGGVLLSELADLEGTRAGALSELGSGIAADEYNALLSTVMGVPGDLFGGLTGLAGAEMNAEALAEMADAQMYTGIGTGIGTIFGKGK